MLKVLVLFAHPALEKSRVHSRMAEEIIGLPGITFHDLYQEYPDFDIDIEKEKQLLLTHDVFVFQHPFYWYSTPAILKEWQDLVLQHNWAYGLKGNALKGKLWMHAISCGASRQAYSPEGINHYTMNELLVPLERTAFLCKTRFLAPFVVHATHRISAPEIEEAAIHYKKILTGLVNETVTDEMFQKNIYLNDLPVFFQP